jgi:hypothetical protein
MCGCNLQLWQVARLKQQWWLLLQPQLPQRPQPQWRHQLQQLHGQQQLLCPAVNFSQHRAQQRSKRHPSLPCTSHHFQQTRQSSVLKQQQQQQWVITVMLAA